MGIKEIILICIIYISGAWAAYGMAKNVVIRDSRHRLFSPRKAVLIGCLSWPAFIYIWLRYTENMWDNDLTNENT